MDELFIKTLGIGSDAAVVFRTDVLFSRENGFYKDSLFIGFVGRFIGFVVGFI